MPSANPSDCPRLSEAYYERLPTIGVKGHYTRQFYRRHEEEFKAPGLYVSPINRRNSTHVTNYAKMSPRAVAIDPELEAHTAAMMPQRVCVTHVNNVNKPLATRAPGVPNLNKGRFYYSQQAAHQEGLPAASPRVGGGGEPSPRSELAIGYYPANFPEYRREHLLCSVDQPTAADKARAQERRPKWLQNPIRREPIRPGPMRDFNEYTHDHPAYGQRREVDWRRDDGCWKQSPRRVR